MKKNLVTFSLILFFIVLIIIWIFFIEPNLLITKHYKINNKTLSGIRIVFASDFHLKKGQEKRLYKIIKKIESQKPDVVLLGGDFIEGASYEESLSTEKTASALAKMNIPYGIFIVMGNHEWWLDGESVKQDFSSHKLTVLSNENRLINPKGKRLFIAGVEDITSSTPDIKKSLNSVDAPVVLLTHSPDIFPDIPTHVTLTLAGHTHGGQVILPFFGSLIVPSEFGKKYAFGLIEEQGKKMIVTKGIGTSIIPVRFNCLPEIVVIDFI